MIKKKNIYILKNSDWYKKFNNQHQTHISYILFYATENVDKIEKSGIDIIRNNCIGIVSERNKKYNYFLHSI